MINAFMSLKFHDGEEDKQKIESLTKALKKAGIKNTVMARDVEKYGKASLPKGKKLMIDYAFPAMKNSDMIIIEFSEKGVGLGIGAGYCYANNVPIYVIAKTGSDISLTMQNLAKEVVFYNSYEDISSAFKRIAKEYQNK